MKANPVRRIVCVNQSNYVINLKVTIEADPDKVNFYVPKTHFHFKIEDKTYDTLMTLIKIDPLKNWGNMKITYEYIAYNDRGGFGGSNNQGGGMDIFNN